VVPAKTTVPDEDALSIGEDYLDAAVLLYGVYGEPRLREAANDASSTH